MDEAWDDDELAALALAADPDQPVDADAVPFVAGSTAPGLLPAWYMPAPMAAAGGTVRRVAARRLRARARRRQRCRALRHQRPPRDRLVAGLQRLRRSPVVRAMPDLGGIRDSVWQRSRPDRATFRASGSRRDPRAASGHRRRGGGGPVRVRQPDRPAGDGLPWRAGVRSRVRLRRRSGPGSQAPAARTRPAGCRSVGPARWVDGRFLPGDGRRAGRHVGGRSVRRVGLLGRRPVRRGMRCAHHRTGDAGGGRVRHG